MAELREGEKEIFPGITVLEGRRGGKPCIAGTRLTVVDVLEYLSSEMTLQEILEDFPFLSMNDIKTVLAFAAAHMKEELNKAA
ncbi:MAG: DUF433 domain-containing protein [Bacteroidota bacterium]